MLKISPISTGIFILLLLSLQVSAQKKQKKERPQLLRTPNSEVVYNDYTYIPQIKSVELYNVEKAQSFPIISLKSTEQLILKFDDLRGGNRNLYYTFVHCDADWQPSSLTPIDYLESFSEDRINDYRISFNTYQVYTHYELRIPNQTVIPKLSGNYLLKVYEDGDVNRLLLSKRFFIVNQKVNVGAQIVQSNIVSERDRRQKINFTISHPGLDIQNPYQEIRAIVMQNSRADKQMLNNRPLFVRNNQLIYSDVKTNDFNAGNEFRRIDTRSLRFKSQTTYNITLDSLYYVALYTDPNWNTSTYTTQYDENGNFFVMNQDGHTPDYDGDYSWVDFTLNAEKPDANGYAYIVGKFNNYQKNAESRMDYDSQKKQFYKRMFIKQGVTDYHYTWADFEGKIINDDAFDGSFFETENDYQILVYYRAPGSRYEELVAYTILNSAQNKR